MRRSRRIAEKQKIQNDLNVNKISKSTARGDESKIEGLDSEDELENQPQKLFK